MKLLLYCADNEIDQVLMVVPDEWDEDLSLERAREQLPGKVYLADTYDVEDRWIGERTGVYRPYVG